MTREEMYQSFDGTSLYLSTLVPEGVRGVVVLVHGLAEHLGRYETLARYLADARFAVYRFDHRGHGRSTGSRAYYSDFIEIIEDVHAIVKLAAQEHPQLPLFVLGHSMGGFAAAGFGTKYSKTVEGIVLTGALTRDNKGLIYGAPQDLAPSTYLPNGLAHLICRDSSVIEAYRSDPLVLTQISAALFYELKRGIQWLRDNGRNFTAPALLLHGADDQIVLEKDSRDFFGDIASTDKELKIYANLYHEILNEPCRAQIFQEIVHWLEKHC